MSSSFIISVLLIATLTLSGCTAINIPTNIAANDQPIPAIETGASTSDSDAPVSSDKGDKAVGDNPIKEQSVQLIPLAGPLATRDAEISAMAWYGDQLVLVPQFPSKFANSLYTLTRSDIKAFLDGTLAGPLTPAPIPLDAGNLGQEIYRYQGFEAITFVGDRVFLTIEAGGLNETISYLVGGTIAPDLSEIVLDTENVAQILPQAAMGNTGDETLVADGERLLTIYEANGVNVNTLPIAHVFGLDLSEQGVTRFPNIEYRITDATAVDGAGNFWAINYFFPGDQEKYQPFTPEPLRTQFGAGPSHEVLITVERLVEFHIGEEGIVLTENAPIQLALIGGNMVLLGQPVGDQIARNWEGIVRLDDRGFLLVTDKFPETLLGFVPYNRR